jgi:hypothetical protein
MLESGTRSKPRKHARTEKAKSEANSRTTDDDGGTGYATRRDDGQIRRRFKSDEQQDGSRSALTKLTHEARQSPHEEG